MNRTEKLLTGTNKNVFKLIKKLNGYRLHGSEMVFIDTDDNEVPISTHDIINILKEVYSKIKIDKYFNKNGKLNEYFIRNVNGNFTFNELPQVSGIRRFNIKIKMNSAETEVYVLLLLLNKTNYINKKNLITGNKSFLEYTRINVFLPLIAAEYLRNLNFINAIRTTKRGRPREGKEEKDNKTKAVINPETKRPIQIKSRKYKEIYGNIILKADVKGLSNISTEDYVIEGNCVFSYVKNNFSKELANKYIPKNPKYTDFMKLMKNQDKSVVFYTITNKIIDSHWTSKYTVPLNIIISQEHMYVVSNNDNNKSRTEIVCKNASDIDKYKNKYIIVKNEKLFKNIKERIEDSKILMDYNEKKLNYKTNIIIYNENYDTLKEYREISDCKRSKSLFNVMNKSLQLIGYLNEDTYNLINNTDIIRHYNIIDIEQGVCTIAFDLNAAYLTALYDCPLPVLSVNDYFKDYNNETLREEYLYLLELNKFDKILATSNGVYGYKQVLELKKDKRIKKIIAYCVPYKSIKIPHEIIPYRNNYKKYKDGAYNKTNLIHMTGFLAKVTSTYNHKYSNITGDELEALKLIYPNAFHNKNENTFEINDTIHKFNSGIAARLIIIQEVNLQMYLFNKKMKELNPECKLVKIATDCVGYITKDKNYKIPKEFIDEKYVGKFKICNNLMGDYYLNNSKYREYIKENKDFDMKYYKNKNKCNILSEDDYEKLIKNNKSFIISGGGGLGKTYSVINKVIPILNKYNKLFLLTSTTSMQANDLQEKSNLRVDTIQDIFKSKRNIDELTKQFKGISYIIIDESVQLTQHYLKKLEYFSNNCGTKIISLLDKNQCIVDSYNGIPWMNTRFAKELHDNNIVKLKWHSKCRYTKELYNILEEIINEDDRDKIWNIVKDKFKVIDYFDTDINLTYTNKEAKLINNNEDNIEMGYMAYTTHKFQGRTIPININYTIHELYKMPKSVLYTALSRACDIKQIRICLQERDLDIFKHKYISSYDNEEYIKEYLSGE